MQVHYAQPHGWLQIVIPLAIFAVIMAIRAPRLMRSRPLNAQQLWVVPALFLVVAGLVFVQHPPTPLGWGLAVIGLLVGGALGWQRGKMMRIEHDPATGQLMQKGSIWAIAFIAVIFALKLVSQNEGDALHFDVNLLIDPLAALSLGMFSVQRLEMYLRATKLMQAARA